METSIVLQGKDASQLPISRDKIGISYSGGGPLVVLELLYRRLLRAERLKKLRSNYIVVLRSALTT